MRKYENVKKKTVFVAMSGGVDSSVAAALLKHQGFEVVGVFMKNWTGPTCTAREDFESAAAAAAHLNIPLYSWNFEEEYKSKVFDYTIREYSAGRTPNPDVMCNKEIKFGLFLKRAIAAGADYIATGHYARKREVKGQKPKFSVKGVTAEGGKSYKLLAGVDKNKDQSYFLWTLTQEKLARILFPIGEWTKAEVRQMARAFGLPNADRPDSQGLCFVGKVDWRDFLSSYVPIRRGAIVNSRGTVIGEHLGVEFYTVGQRHGIGIGGGAPYYVAAKIAKTNTLVVARSDDPILYRDLIFVSDVNWIAGQEPKLPFRATARIRYRQPLENCLLRKDESSSGYQVYFDKPQRGVAPGQSIVFYDGEEVLGGGIIEE
jgi:tRNA-specific 2-thiouridylase